AILGTGALSTALIVASLFVGEQTATAATSSYDINTLAGKVASLHGTAGLQIRFSAFIEQEANDEGLAPLQVDGPTLAADTNPLLPPAVTVNQDTGGAPQNETAIAVDPNNPNRIVAAANDYVTRTWDCTLPDGTACGALGDAYSGTYFSNDGGKTWGAKSSDPQHPGTLIPGVTHLLGGSYDGGGDPSLAFDSKGNVYYAGLGFDRSSAPNTVEVSPGSFDSAGALHWSQPTFINATTSKSVFNDKEWIAADYHSSSPYRDRVYVTWTRFVFNPQNGKFVNSPILEAHSSDGGKTFSTPKAISANVHYGSGSNVLTGPDGTVYVFYDGATRLSTVDSTYMVKSTDGGDTWSTPVQVSPLAEIDTPADTAFRVNSFPAAALASDGTLYSTWSTYLNDNATGVGSADFCTGDAKSCHAQSVYSRSTDGGAHWSAPAPVPGTNVGRTAVGYAGSGQNPPAAKPADSVFPSVAAGQNGSVYFGSYVGDVVSPWQSCTTYSTGSLGCTKLGPQVDNAKLDYVVSTPAGAVRKASTAPINTRYGFQGTFIGDYTDLAVGSDGVVHPLWTDTSNEQTVTHWLGKTYNPGVLITQQDVATNPLRF
ncbi:MAG: hypothetical protein J2O49_07670, partial [Sciscionella sp.]|nr:hypothetical protein [Sciscionella sp.]